MLWSYATICHPSPPPKLFDTAAIKVIYDLEQFKPQAISTTLWSFAKIGHYCPGLFHAALHEVIQKLDEFSEQALF